MIRIDEIYNNTFWPWVEQNRPGTRLFFCDPPGHTDPEHLFNHGQDNVVENNFIFMHDQEPVDVDLYKNLFDEVIKRNLDIQQPLGPQTPIMFDGHVVVSEQGEFVEKMCKLYGWKSHYYFYHGWACQDWFRGYDRTFLIPRAKDRHPTNTFMCPNRIIAGKRDHRVLFLYHLFKQNLAHNHISAPRICPAESIDIVSVAQKYTNVYQDIADVFTQASLPRTFSGETTQQMASCWLTNFAEAQDSLVYVATETVYFGRRTHITEKTFKAIAMEMPFVLVAPAGSLKYLQEYGFQTFSTVFDESYDDEQDDFKRLELVAKLLKDLDNLSVKEREQIHRACLPMVEHNFNHFYRGGFSDILWTELTDMLKELRV
jgi:hypothetical protein